MNQPCGVNIARVAMTSGACAVGVNEPPRTASVMATAELAAPAASTVGVNEITRAEIPMAAVIAPTTTSATPTGGPQAAPISSVVATTSTVMAAAAWRNEPSVFPASTVHGRMGPARMRPRVPRRRSSNRLTSPVWAEKNRNRTAIDAEK